jgi:mannose-6-phosphate isomerase-like protein (cupin superfamily)
MAETGDALTLPDGTSFSIIESAAESAGERIEFEVTMNPDAQGPPKDFHPRQHESWRVLEGELSVFVEDAWQTLGEGSELSIPHGTVHTLRNRSAEVVPFATYTSRHWTSRNTSRPSTARHRPGR